MKKRLICYLIVLCMLAAHGNFSIAMGEEDSMGLFDRLTDYAVRQFLGNRGILTEDREAYDYAEAFLTLSLQKDIVAMKKLFAPNAIAEIGEDQLDEMLEEFIDYFQADAFTLEIPIGPATSEHRDHGKKSKELSGPLDILAGDTEYRLAIKCVAYDDWDADNVGIWSISILEKSRDSQPESPYYGDKQYRSGVYTNVLRPD